MESSEDDAGTATSASRRESAREKDLGRLEDVDATSSIQQDTSELRTSCQTPAMSEDNFDGDSVPSPSTHDVNTSTEAILDMIDEIVDGPGAPKRLPLLLDTDAENAPTSCEQQNEQALESATPEPELGLSTSSIIKNHNSDVENVGSDTKCTPKTQIEDISMQANPCDSVKNSHTDDVNINIKHQSPEISENPKHGLSDNCESFASDKSCLSEVSETGARVKSNTESVACVSSEVGQSSCTQKVTVFATVPSVAPLCSKNIRSSNIRSVERNIESPINIENHVNISELQLESITCVSTNNVESSNGELLESATHCLQKEVERTEILSNSCSISGDDRQSSQIESEGNLKCKNTVTSPNIVLAASICESSDTVESSSNLEILSTDHISSVPLSKSVDCGTNDSPIKIDIESSRTETSKNAPVLEQSKRSEMEPSSASNLASKTSCDNNSNNECVPGSGTRNTQVIENSETSLNIENISKNTSNSESTIAMDPAVSKAGLSLENLEDTIKTVVSNIQQATSSKSLSSPLPSIPSSSVTRSEGSISMEAMNDRLKCVTTCEKRDIVVVESAESTSSDCSASEVKSYSVESMSRIPLRRRLVRPALSRPDSTVSSTVDSSITPHTSEHSSECIKDVSSSSDAVTTVQDSDNTEDIRSVSEISICKAETSTSPHKKIRLIRRKNDPQLNSTPFESLIRESKECESTSSCEEKLTVTSEQVPSVSVSSHIKENLDYKSSPDITDNSHLENSNDSPTPSSSLKNPELIRYPDNKEHERVPPLKLHIPNENKVLEKLQSHEHSKGERSSYNIELKEEKLDESERIVPKLTIKVNNTPCDKPDLKSPIPKLTIKPLKVPISEENDRISEEKVFKANITKLNIKPILKPPEKINEIHRKSSSSEISESEYSENDDSTSTSDPPSANEQGPLDVVPKVTIKLGKPGTDSEGKFYTESNIPKLTIKGIQNSNEEGRESPSKLKLVVCQSEEKQMEKVPKLTIKSVSISEGQPLSPKLTIKPLKPPDGLNRDILYEDNPPIPKLIISTDSSNSDQKDQSHVHKVTIKPITKPDTEAFSKTPKKTMPENLENIPVITKLNIKPVIKPDNNLEVCNKIDEKVPIVSKINIKPIIKPIEVDFSKEDNIPKITKLNIKPIKSPDGNSSRDTDCQEDTIEETKPIITKLNIKPILKPKDEDISKESENHSSENSSDDNNDNIPIVTKINIKPICRPTELEETEPCNASKDENIPIVPKLIIKPLVKPDQPGPQSPKKERTSSPDLRNQNIPVVTKLNIKPIVKPDENQLKLEDGEDVKNPPLLMKINRKTRSDSGSDTQYHIDKGMDQYNNIHHNIPIISKLNVKPNFIETKSVCNAHESLEQSNYAQIDNQHDKQDLVSIGTLGEVKPAPVRQANQQDLKLNHKGDIENNFEETSNRVPSTTLTKELNEGSKDSKSFSDKTDVTFNYQISNIQKPVMEEEKQLRQKSQPTNTNCTLLKKLLENRKYDNSSLNSDSSPNTSNSILPVQTGHTPSNDCTKHEIIDLCNPNDDERESPPAQLKIRSMEDLCNEVSESVTKPLEISISDKINQCSDQDSPRIILKINKTDHGASAKIITDEIINKNETKGVSTTDSMMTNRRRPILLGRKKQESESANVSEGKKLRSSRIVQSPEKSSFPKKNTGKRPSNLDSSTGPPSPKEAELSVLDSKRLKLGQLLSSKTLTITPVVVSKTGPITPTDSLEIRQAKINHSLLNNENCSKNGSSKLHNILSNLQAKQQLKVMPLNDLHSERKHSESPELKSGGTSLDSNPNIQVESEPVHQNCDEIRDTLFQESAESRDYNITPDPLSRDPLEVVTLKGSPDITAEDAVKIPSIVEMTPQPKKRGRPRKLPVSEGAKPLVLPTPALEERPQRSLRLSRDRPVLIVKPRGRGRGRGRRMDPEQTPPQESGVVDTANKFFDEKTEEIDPTSSRIKLPRMTEALDKMPSTCATPLTSRRRTSSSSTSDMPFYNTDTPEFKMVDTSLLRMEDPFAKSPEMLGRGGRGGRGSRGRGRATPRTPRGRGRGRGGGRGAMYMKETMGIYGRVCGPATTTVQLFEEETCMMDDNATPAKPSHLLDEDSQSSVKSSTNESSKAKKSKFADLFDSNKVWSASDVKEYTWPPPENRDASEHQVMMIQEQVAMFLGVKSFKRRYPELKRRAISAAEKDYVLSKGIVTEALCDLGITAVDASEVLDIMLSDYPHKYEEYRSYQREKQLSDPTPEPVAKEPREIRMDRASDKPEPPKVDPEKTRLIMAAAAIASASEWNARMNALRRPACVDLQSLTIQRRRAPTPSNPQIRVTPPHGFYPHALLPGQYQHTYRAYTSEQLRYFPLNTVVAAAPAPPSPQVSSSESEPDWSHASSSDSEDTHRMHKRKKLTKVKRSSETEVNPPRVEEPEVDTCRTCKLRLEANRKTTHERFLVCATCNAKLHPGCVDLQPDTIRKCREYAWQCNECKTCCSCSRPADAKMMFCDLCDRGHHLYCLGLQRVPDGRWHCAECAICKSCGGRSPGGPPAPGSDPSSGPQGSLTEPGGPHWHHQTRRGPGGHKVYSHSLCTPCARAYRIGRYCPLCERSFIGPKGTMQLVICKLCDRQLHQDCVKQTVSSLNVLDYTCGECRRGGITSRAAAVRLAPRTIATLFMAKRRFNKYAHRQYMEKCKGQSKDSCPDRNEDDSDNDLGDTLPDDGD